MYIPEPVLRVMERLEECGFEAFAVGGCVRDSLMGRTPGDYDVTTSAVPAEMLDVFRGWRVVETGLQHGTVTVVTHGMNVEVTAYRLDGVYLDNRHPSDVTFTRSLAEDLARRDFTVNAMAYSPVRGIVDLYDGRGDLARRVIRCVGSAEKRFGEDGLRILRAIRFSAVLGFTPEAEDTSPAIHRMAYLLQGISRERIHVELRKLLGGKCAGEILTEYGDVVEQALPELPADLVKEAGKRICRLQGTDMPHAGDASLRFAVLLAGLEGADAKSVVRSLKMSREEEREIYALLEDYKTYAADRSRYTLRRLAGKNGYAHLYRLSAFLAAAEGKSLPEWTAENAEIARMEVENPPNTLKELAVSGEDLMLRGFAGKQIGGALQYALDLVLRDEAVNEKDVLLERIGEWNG
ncbi:MAG: polynucleotide adenylyltransferase [Ruminococcaceae bacterium]|nr:polynucleotide adenylyltransferase [Oscillospiraceae bacterium]